MWTVETTTAAVEDATVAEQRSGLPEGRGGRVERRARRKWAGAATTVMAPFALVAVVLLFWQFAIPRHVIPGIEPVYLSTPAAVLKQFGTLVAHGYTGTPLWLQVWASLRRTLLGVGFGTAIGVPLGLAMGLSAWTDKTLGPIVGFLRPIPALAWIPIVVIWFGIGEASKIFVIGTTSGLFVATAARLGAQAVPRDYYLVAENYGLSRWRRMWHVVIPPALPHILAGVRTALTVGWAVVVAAELIGASSGLGYMIGNASNAFQVDTVYVGIFLIGCIGVAFEYGVQYLERHVLHWQRYR